MNSVNSNQGITRVPHSKMLKSEMADYADRTIDIVEEFAPDSAIINPLLNLLKVKKPDIEVLRLIYGIDTERMKVANLKGVLMLKVSALKLNVRMLKRSNLELDLHVVENAIKSYLRYLDKCKNDKQLNQRVVGFLELVQTNEELATALDEFNLIGHVTAINMVHDAFNNAMANRVKLLSLRSKVSTRVIVKGVFDAITNLFKAIEVGHLVSPATIVDGEEGDVAETDFTPLINELSQLSEMYNRSIAIRSANNKRKAAANKQEPDKAPEGQEPTAPEGDAATMSIHHSPVDEALPAVRLLAKPLDENGAEKLRDVPEK